MSSTADVPDETPRRGRWRPPGVSFDGLRDPDVVLAVLAPVAAAVVTLYLVIPTLLPGVASWDTAEFQTVGPLLGTAHPTGYPSYVILGWVASIVLQPFGNPAFRMNLLQAFTAAVAVAGTVGLVQLLTGRRWIALATGLMLACSQLFWRLATHADPHMLHLALVAILFTILLTWDRRRRSEDPEIVRHADRWLVAAALVYGVAVANHSLALLLPPAIGLFVLAVDWRVVLRWRTVLACAGVLMATVTVFFLELPIRAAMHAPLVYGHPDTLRGFTYVVLAEQFRGSLVDPLGDLGGKLDTVFNLISGWLGPVGIMAAIGFGTSVIRRPRYALLSGLAVLVTCFFAASYDNADIERYYLVPLFLAFTWVGLGLADALDLLLWMVPREWVAPDRLDDEAAPYETAQTAEEPTATDSDSAEADSESAGSAPAPSWTARGTPLLEWMVAIVLLVGALSVAPERQLPEDPLHPGAVSEAASTAYATWERALLAPPDQGGLPADAVFVSWWSDSTTLWYGQKVEGLRPDVYIVDDRTRLDDNLGEVWDVIDRFLGKRPVFLDRLSFNPDGILALSQIYDLKDYALAPDGRMIEQVVSRKGTQ